MKSFQDVERLLGGGGKALQKEEEAKKLIEEAKVLREEHIQKVVTRLRKKPLLTGSFWDCAMHYYGQNITELTSYRYDKEVVAIIGREPQYEGEEIPESERGLVRLQDATEPTPVFISTPSAEYFHREQPMYSQELRLVMVGGEESAFYSRYEIEKDVRMHAFTDSVDDVARSEFGIVGPTFSASADTGNSLGCRIHSFDTSDRCVLEKSSNRLNGRGSCMGDYSFSNSGESLFQDADGAITVAVGWSAIEGLVLAESSRQNVIRAAKNFGRFVDFAWQTFGDDQAIPRGKINDIIKADKLLDGTIART